MMAKRQKIEAAESERNWAKNRENEVGSERDLG